MTEPARIKIEMGFKANVGNFQTVNVIVALEDSVSQKDIERNPAHNGVDACGERVYSWVEGELERRLEQAKKAIKEVNGK